MAWLRCRSSEGGSSLATSADGYFRNIAESVVDADFTEAKRNRQGAKKSVVFCF
jgi:hypothetical protein